MRELSRESVAAVLRARDRYNRDIEHAWNVERVKNLTCHRKRLPHLAELYLREALPARPQSITKLRSALSVIGGQFGLKPRRMSEAAWAAIRRN